MQKCPENITVIHSILLAALGLAQKQDGRDQILDCKRLQATVRPRADVSKAMQRLSPAISIRKKEINQYLRLLRDRNFARRLEQDFAGNLEQMLAMDPAAITNPVTLLNCPLPVFYRQFPRGAATIATFIGPELTAFRFALLVFADINGLLLEGRDLDLLYVQLRQPGSEQLQQLVLDGLGLLGKRLDMKSATAAYQCFARCVQQSSYPPSPRKAGL